MTFSRYLLVSLPLHDSASATWTSLQHSISKIAFDTPTYKLHIPELRVGTLDSLLALSDDLLKASSVIEGVTHKVRRQIEELDRTSGIEAGTLSVEGVPIDSYITRFTWDEAKYPVMTPLREVVDTIHESVSKLEDDLKVRVAEYSNVKTQLSTISRKQAGSMAVRELSTLVKSEDVISSEHLTTLLVVVSKYSQKEWITSYETLSDFVVPRSSKKLHEDNEYALYTVVVFRRVADTFKTAARERSFQVREYEHDPEGRQKREEEIENLMKDQENLRNNLQQWCYASYGEVFSSWMHVCVIRLFTESILRYGLPPAFLAAVLAPSIKNEKKIRAVLENLSGGGNSAFWKSDDDPGMIGLIGGDTEVHPYVSLTINLNG
ncbi:hypothetical protein O6H91_18G082800 [Diphasiastrum complanatum]|uniref:Uncharacterized protein n=2 Tax=Diphasiastrum complanatum TaxID=34168 RepID=A0ACC2B399_DIPCM|nr:hypothetical protein O6H91_18G082800 [Diphasiastrum complanatum]